MNHRIAILCSVFGCIITASANVIGTNVPAKPITAERVANLPAWKSYLENSQRQHQAELDAFRAELKANHLTNTVSPPKSDSPTRTPLNAKASWYASDEARRIAGNVISYQTPAGGWSKHTDYTHHHRAPGELFAADSSSKFNLAADFDKPADVRWSYIGTFDNGATITELRFLAKVISASKSDTSALQKSFLRGLDYIFAAQFPNGGWPQVWPLQGGYHDAVTFNDNAMLNVIKLLRDVSLVGDNFAFVPADVRGQADASWKHGLECVLAAQVMVDNRRTAWGQQHDALTLKPVSARNYEMPSLASGESAMVTLFLMQLPNPDSNVVAAVHAAVAWFDKTKIEGKEFKNSGADGRMLQDAPGAGPLWSRYYEIGTNKPLFGDRDKSIHDDVNEISRERRKGYGWFINSGKSVLQQYAKWSKTHPLK
jgi:PelA/Pel-15E family pectate lyase